MRKQNRYRVTAERQTGALQAPQVNVKEHLDAIISFAGAGQRRRLFRGLDILTIKLALDDLPEESRFLLSTQLMFLKKEKDPTWKLFDDDEWIRSLTEAQEITADNPEDSVMYDQQAVDPKKGRSIQMGGLPAEIRLRALSKGEIAALTTAMRQLGVGSEGGAEALTIFHQLIFDEWASGTLGHAAGPHHSGKETVFGLSEW